MMPPTSNLLLPGELYHSALHAEADAEEGLLVKSAPLGRLHLALHPTEAEAAGHDDAVRLAERLPRLMVLDWILGSSA